MGLRSADFDISISDNNANITTRGYGHGVGMSQYGANGMANAGYGYKDILYRVQGSLQQVFCVSRNKLKFNLIYSIDIYLYNRYK